MNKKVVKWLAILFLVVIPFVFVIYWLNDNLLSEEEWMTQYKEYAESISYDGVVVRKIYDSEPRKLKNIVLVSQNLDSIFVDYRIQPAIYQYIELGDSISKKARDLSVNIYRNGVKDTSLIYQFE